MKRLTMILGLALGVALLSACGPGQEESPTTAAATQPAQSPAEPSPSPMDPSVTGCALLRDLGLQGGPEDYRSISAILTGTGDARLAAEAVRLHTATGTSLDPVDTRLERLDMLSIVLDVAEECLRVTG